MRRFPSLFLVCLAAGCFPNALLNSDGSISAETGVDAQEDSASMQEASLVEHSEDVVAQDTPEEATVEDVAEDTFVDTSTDVQTPDEPLLDAADDRPDVMDVVTTDTPRDTSPDVPRDVVATDTAPTITATARDLGVLPFNGRSARNTTRSVWIQGTEAWTTTDLDATDGIMGLTRVEATAGTALNVLPASAAGCAGFFGSPYGALTPINRNEEFLVPFRKECVVAAGMDGYQGFGIGAWIVPTTPARLFSLTTVPMQPELTHGPAGHRPSATTRLTIGGTTWIYAYDCRTAFVSFDCRLARAPLTQPQLPDTWTYWNGRAWVADPATRAVVVNTDSADLSIAFNTYLNAYIMISGQWADRGIVLRTAPAPEGPWSPRIVLHTLAAPSTGNPRGVFLHDEYTGMLGRTIFVSHTTSVLVGGTHMPQHRLLQLFLTR